MNLMGLILVIAIRKISWGKGFGFEAAKVVLNYGFSELGLEKVVGLTAEQNYGSIRILEKLGFKFQEKFLFNNTKAFKYFKKLFIRAV